MEANALAHADATSSTAFSTSSTASAAPAPPASQPGSSAALRIVSWNIGLRGLHELCTSCGTGPPDVHGIRRRVGFGSLASLLSEMDADIVCFQEVKLRELGAPERALALADGWDSHFALCRAQNAHTSYGRYAGTATFSRTACRPRLAEEGVTGAYAPSRGAVGQDEELAQSLSESERREIDSEGRCGARFLAPDPRSRRAAAFHSPLALAPATPLSAPPSAPLSPPPTPTRPTTPPRSTALLPTRQCSRCTETSPSPTSTRRR